MVCLDRLDFEPGRNFAQHSYEFRAALELGTVEIAELKQQRTQLAAKGVHRFQKMIEVVFPIHQNPFMSYDLRNFCSEAEAGRSFVDM
jgi:hypothetical protein